MEQETTIELREYFEILKKRIWIVITVTLLATVVSGVVSFFLLTPIYEASTQLLVNKAEDKSVVPNFNDIQSNLKLIDTYNVIIKSPRILEATIKNLKLPLTSDQLSSKVTVAAVQNSQVISITVQDPSPEKAVMMANGLASTFQHEIKSIMSVDNVQILAKANLPEHPSPVKPKKSLNVVIAFVVGLMVSVGIVFLLEYLDNSLKTEQDIERVLELSVLGSVATIDYRTEDKLAKETRHTSVGGERFEV